MLLPFTNLKALVFSTFNTNWRENNITW